MHIIEHPLEHAVKIFTGRTAQELRRIPLGSYRKFVEKKRCAPIRFVSRYPYVGRGNVLRDRNLSAEEVEAMLDKALDDGE